MNKIFEIQNKNEKSVQLMHPQILAFVGDAVHTLFVRHSLSMKHLADIKTLHCDTTAFVKAESQSRQIENILPLLSETELRIFKRARNHHTTNIAKNASATDYRKATGFEAVLGYLYLTENFERLNQLLSIASDETKKGGGQS